MTAKEFEKAIKSGTAKGAYLFEGTEEYLKEEMLAFVRKVMLAPGFELLNESVMDDPDLLSLRDAALAVPFMCDKRLVVARDLSAFKKNQAEGGEESKSSAENLALLKEIMEGCDTSVVILYHHASAQNNKAKKLFAENNRLICFDTPSEAEILNRLRSRFKAAQVDTDDDALMELIASCGSSLMRLFTECDKLIAYKGPGGYATVEDILNTITPDTEKSVFNLIDAMTDGKAAEGYRILENLMQNNERPTEILNLITRQFRLMAHIKTLTENGIGISQIKEKLALKYDSMVKNLSFKVKNMDAEKLTKCYIRSVEAEFQIKQGRIGDREGLDEMLVLMYELKKR